MSTPSHPMRLPAEGGQGEFVIRLGLGVSAVTRTTDEQLRRQCDARLGVFWEPAGDEELRRQCVARLGVFWSHPPGSPARGPDANQRDGAGLRPAAEDEGGWISEGQASTVSSPVGEESGSDTAQDRVVDGRLAAVPTWLDDERRVAHEAEGADRRWRDAVDEKRRVMIQLGAAQEEASVWRRAAESASSRNEVLKSQADEAGASARRCSNLLQQAAEAQGVREEELACARHEAKEALDSAAKAEDELQVLQGRTKLLTTRVAEAEATTALLRGQLASLEASHKDDMAQAARDIDMRTEELNSLQDRFEEVASEKARMERRAFK